MAEVKSEHIAINELRALNKDASNMMFEGSRVRIAWAEGKRVWDIWETILSAYDTINVESKATTLTKSLLNLQSYGTDRLGVNHDMAYTISPTSISANTSTSSKNHTVTVKQTATGKSVSVTATQKGNVQTTTYQNFRITGYTYSDVPAGGGTIYPTISYAYDKVVTNSNGLTGTTTIMTGTTSSCKVTSKSSSSSYIGTVNTSNGSIYASSLYDTLKSRSSIALIYGISISVTVGGVSRTITYSTNRYVYQEANTRSEVTSKANYFVETTDANQGSLGSSGGTFTIEAKCVKQRYWEYTSGSGGLDSTWEAVEATVTGTNCTVSPTSFISTSYVEITGTVGMGTTSERTISITVTAKEKTSAYDTTSIKQESTIATPSYYIEVTQVSQTINGTFTDYTNYQSSDNAFAAVDEVWFKATVRNNKSTSINVYASALYGQGYNYSGEWMNVSMSDRMRNSSKTLVNYVTLSGNSSTTVYFLWNNIGAHYMPSDEVFYLDFVLVDDDGNYVSNNVDFVMVK